MIKPLLLAVAFCCLSAQAVTVADLAKHPEFYNVKISPDGKHLAILVNKDNHKTLAFMRTKDYQITYALSNSSDQQPGQYYWVNNERVLIQIERIGGSLEQPRDYGEIYGINYDGSKQALLNSYKSPGLARSNYGQGGYTQLLYRLPEDERNVLVSQTNADSNAQFVSQLNIVTQVQKMNIYTGRMIKEKVSPIGYNRFLVDNNGVPRFVVGKTATDQTKLFYSDGKGEQWISFDEDGENFQPLAFSQDNQSVFALKSVNGAPAGLYRYDLASQKQTLLYQSNIASPTAPLKSSISDIYGVRLDEDYPNYFFIRDDLRVAQIHQALVQAFKGSSVEITSRTDDGKLMVVHVSSDRDPGQFYLFNTDTMKAKFLLTAMAWIKPAEMSPTEAFRIKTADGQSLTGYLTLPKNSDGKNLPTIVMPHGGPHARDYWRFSAWVQTLASQGYAVVQVNFRGSTGFGSNFMRAGYQEWGGKIQDDIYAATQYAIQTGVSSKDHICIAGGSFGGYSAVQSAIRYPDTYKCAIGYAGVYDLPLLYKDGDIKDIRWGDSYLDKTLGLDNKQQQAMSPTYNVNKLKAALFIVHGEEDKRAPISQAYALKKALDDIQYPYEWMVKANEGHGFYKEENIREFYDRSLAFIKKNI
ncbi:peptidase S9 [Shewanella mangrovi]|uniref:Peptidase S9 n=1 Tax=Shewanella mangrovi TaxID=1515746 RepID=A0A094LQT5_9GAMM|nr:S9 family peptidase [Shewanella mangrovi]KFZ37543.1 peptidase S9 [Shewanella mangrovi]